MDGERAHAVEGRGLPVDGAGGRPGGAPGQLVLADLVRGERGGPRGAAEERGEMGDPAAGGAVGPELPHLVVLEVGVAEIAQGRPLGAERARRRCRRAGGTGGGGRAGLVRGMGWVPPWWRPRADGVRPHSLWWPAQSRGWCRSDGDTRRPGAHDAADVWAEDHRHARPCLSGTDADIGLTDRPSPAGRESAGHGGWCPGPVPPVGGTPGRSRVSPLAPRVGTTR